MCIKLTRHFQCSPRVRHTREYLIRCSNPTFLLEDIMSMATTSTEPPRQPCLDEDELESLEEWYNESCPNCTGERDAPKGEAVRILARDRVPDDNGDCQAVFENPALIGEDSMVSVYTQNLAVWLFAYMFSPWSSLMAGDPLLQAGIDIETVRKEKIVCALNELICQAQPEHGSPWRLVHLYRLVEDGETVVPVEGGFELQALSDGCGCLSTQDPGLSNWALYIRRMVACDVYTQMVDPENDDLTDEELAAVREVEQRVFERCAQLQRAVVGSPQGVLPVLQIRQMPKVAMRERAEILAEDAAWLVAVCQELVPDLEDPDEQDRHKARASLLKWARLILTYDSGISTKRARVIMAFFVVKVVTYDPGWARFEPQECGRDACERLARAANTNPRGVRQWVRETLLQFKDGSHDSYLESYLSDSYTYWVWKDRVRAAAVYGNMAIASEAEFAELNATGIVCAICLESFVDLGDNPIARIPVQNRHCHLRGHHHWSCRNCLIRSARVQLDGVSPRCPVCRAEFANES